MADEGPRKILIVTDAWKPQINGVVRTYEYLAPELEALGHTVRVIGPSHFPVQFPMPGYAEIRLAAKPYARLSRMIRDFVPDSIHIATEGPLGQAARRWCLKHDRRFTTAYHTQFPDYVARRVARFLPRQENRARQLVDNMVRRFHSAASGIIITTATLEDELKGRGYKTPLFRMVRGVPVDLFTPGPSPLFQDVKHPVALYVGRIAVEKNLEAFLSLPFDGTKVVVGEGPDRAMLEKKYPGVMFTGSKTGSDLRDHYRAADIFVFPSRTDTFGIVLLEALACGLPVAAYDVTGPRDIITNPVLGSLHKNDLGKAFEAALKQAGSGKAERHAYVRNHYTWAVAAREFMGILKATNS